MESYKMIGEEAKKEATGFTSETACEQMPSLLALK